MSAKEEFEKIFGNMYLSSSETALRVFEHGYKAGQDALRKSLEQPEREWQGLTDEDIAEGAKQSWVARQAFESAVWWAEEKLKEKNCG